MTSSLKSDADRLLGELLKEGGATTSLSISAASIVANIYFNRIMRTHGVQYPAYGFSEHKGYVTQRHVDALLRYGPRRIHHLHDETVRKTLAQRARKSEISE
jgi:ribonuclease HII